jgi:chemotaxis protein MotB
MLARASVLVVAAGCATAPPPPAQVQCPPPPPPIYSKDCVLKSEVMNLIDRIHNEADDNQVKLDQLEKMMVGLREDVAHALAATLKALPQSEASVAVVGGKVRVRLSDQLLFQSNSARITPAGYKALSEISNVLKTTPTRRIEIAGHTDSNPIHKGWDDNWQLSSERARQVLLFLISRGIEGKRMFAGGYADTDPVDVSDSDAARSRNRRVDIFIEPVVPEAAKTDEAPAGPEKPREK